MRARKRLSRPRSIIALAAVACFTVLGIPTVTAGAVDPPPTVTGVSPGTGGPSLTVTVRGSGFDTATAVLFGDTISSSFFALSPTLLTVVAPNHALGPVDVTVMSPSGTSATSAADRYTYIAPPAALHWTAPAKIDTHGPLTGLSCSSTTFCMAVDTGGYAIAHTQGQWQKPRRVDYGHGALVAVSCSSYTFCAAVDDHGFAFTYHSGRWGFANHVDSHAFTAVSCATHLLCIATDDFGREVGYTGDRWHTPGRLSPANERLGSVSCPTAIVCYVAGGDGGVVIYRRNGPGDWHLVFQGGGFEDGTGTIDCPSATSCVVILAEDFEQSAFQDYWVLNGTLWTTVSQRAFHDGAGFMHNLSCPTVGFCLTESDDLSGQSGTYLVGEFNGAGEVVSLPPGLVASFDRDPISCATARNCVVLGSDSVVRGTA
jgi:hypothetical protein